MLLTIVLQTLEGCQSFNIEAARNISRKQLQAAVLGELQRMVGVRQAVKFVDVHVALASGASLKVASYAITA
jgi:hypothetical protein